MGFKSEMLEARDEFIALVKDELLGPGSEVSVPDAEHELITTLPEKRYSIGILFPKDNKMKADENDVDRAEQEDNAESEEPTESIASDNSDYVEVKIPKMKRAARISMTSRIRRIIWMRRSVWRPRTCRLHSASRSLSEATRIASEFH
ncbi:MAG: hypothetical protein ACLRWB_03535 [Gallintestinimicrobium sp.]|uniref:hypothetical protein n=1 Tax=Gallintestinimicrobium sp. TaxID=2981655 RepID=UPI00399FD8EA